jgi:2-polyprenyl-3-methyl-5-hydroxy-6-metoxy-1,4-benzoquinol methylase
MSYQRIKIGGKTFVEGTNRKHDYEWIFPEKPEGKTIIDIGCHFGYYVLQAAWDGAEYCLGMDISRKVLRVGSQVAKQLKLRNINFVEENIENIGMKRCSTWPFDIVLCLNLLHHLENIDRGKRVLEKIDAIAREQMIFCLSLPKNGAMAWAEEINKKGNRRLRLTLQYLQCLWPTYSYEYTNSIANPDRLLVRVMKGEPNARNEV